MAFASGKSQLMGPSRSAGPRQQWTARAARVPVQRARPGRRSIARTHAVAEASKPAPREAHNQAQAAMFARGDIVKEFMQPLPQAVEERLAAIAGAVPGLGPESRVIDAGCGTGALIPHLQARGVSDIVAADLSPEMLAAVKARFGSPGTIGNNTGVRTWCSDFADLPVYMGSADAIFLNAMFGNVHDQHFALTRAAQLLKPGGWAVISHPEGRAWHTNLKASSPALVPHELPAGAALEALLFESPFELVELRDDPYLYMAVLRLPTGFALPSPAPLAGRVVTGFGRGSRDLAVPTANIDPAPLAGALAALPRGVYFGWARLDAPAGCPPEDSAVHKMVMNVGRRPTVNTGDEAPTVEVHILHDFAVEDFRGSHLSVVATSYLRPEMKFDGLPALIKRIKADIGIARSQLDAPALQAAAGHPSLGPR
ncbi:MAG: Flavokinase-domain-containing protein [Monoraphidium minutum]|nr:MAG: Flavokinase-domain-containing protein [Monoraphidium minutum]